MEQLIKRKEELKLEYYDLLNQIQEIIQKKEKRIKEQNEKLKKKGIVYKTFRRKKYLLELNKLKWEAKEVQSYYHDLEEIRKIKKRIMEINSELVGLNSKIEEFQHHKRI